MLSQLGAALYGLRGAEEVGQDGCRTDRGHQTQPTPHFPRLFLEKLIFM